jgi:hypothetical protein
MNYFKRPFLRFVLHFQEVVSNYIFVIKEWRQLKTRVCSKFVVYTHLWLASHKCHKMTSKLTNFKLYKVSLKERISRVLWNCAAL